MIARTLTPDQIRAEASDAGSELAWKLVGTPSRPGQPLSPANLLALQSRGDAATRDPAAFVKAFFDAIDNAVSDAAMDAREAAVPADERYGVVGQFTPR